LLPALCVGIAVLAWVYPESIFISLGNWAPGSWKKRYRKHLGVLNLNISPEQVAGIRLAGFTAGILVAVVLGISCGAAALLGIALALLALLLPEKWLQYLEKRRIDELSREFPIMVTLVRVYSKAADLYKALYIVRDAVEGEMKRQLDLLAAEMAVYPLNDALDNFALRCRYMPVSNFVAVVQYGLATGSDIDDILETFSRRTYHNRVNVIKRRIKTRPLIMVIIPAFMMLALALLLIVPLFTNIITRLQAF
jgi:Flp pilus assembly protein TadB